MSVKSKARLGRWLLTAPRRKHFRWWIAELTQRSSAYCWASVVPWALHWDTLSLRELRGSGTACQVESAIKGDCYCGKFVDGCLRAAVGVPADQEVRDER